MNVIKYKNLKPKLLLENFFNGDIEAWGLFEDRFGIIRKRFTCKIQAKFNKSKNTIEVNENFTYDDKIPLLKKIETVANKIYRASSVEISETVKEQLSKLEQAGYSKFPICIAKTQYSFSVDPKIKGAPTDHKLEVREIRLSSGAEFIVVICGTIMTMPGLPRIPAADKIKLNKKGDIEGLF